jgi:hypothetical protein
VRDFRRPVVSAAPGSFPRVGDLVAAIRRFVDGWNQHCQPFVWVKDPDIMIKATRKRTSGTEH